MAKKPTSQIWIGDPCYVVPNSAWQELLEETRYFNYFITDEQQATNSKPDQGGTFKVQINGWECTMACHSTEHGDGRYEDLEDRTYPVDSGSLSVWFVDELNAAWVTMPEGTMESSGHIVEVPADYVPEVTYQDGTLDFGPVEIDTGWED